MRDDYASFNALGTEILVVARHEKSEMQSYWQKEKIPFIGIADPEGEVADRFGQQRKLFGPLPAQILVDCQGKIAMSHYGSGKADIVSCDKILDSMNLIRVKSNCPDRPATQADEEDNW